MKELLSRLDDKLWLRFNRRPSSRAGTYSSIIFPWVVIGMMIGLGIVITGIILGKSDWSHALGFASILMAWVIMYAVLCTHSDDKQGYVDAIQLHYLKRREARMEKIVKAHTEKVV